MKVNKLMNVLLVFLILIFCVGAASASEDALADDTLNSINTGSMAIDQDSAINEIDNNKLTNHNEGSNVVSDSSNSYVLENDESSMSLSSSKLGEGNNIYVKNGAKDGDGTQAKPFGSLKDALALAGDGDTIIINASVAATLKGENNIGLVISQNGLTIKTEGTKKITVNAEKKNQIFDITGNNVCIQGLAFTNGNSTNGGAISVKGNGVSLEDCSISSSVAKDGAGIYVDGDGFTLNRCNLSSNNAEHAGGGIYIADHKDISIKDSRITSNRATSTGSLGGGIYNAAHDTKIENCYLYGSKANNGGGIYSSERISVEDSTVNSGSVTATHGLGGGICLNTEKASESKIDNVSFGSCYADQGGAIALVNCNNVLVNNCSMGQCIGYVPGGTTADSDGTAIWMNGKNNVINDTYIHDCASYGYGNVYVPVSSTNTTIDNCRFERCTSDYHGAAVYSRADDLKVNNSYFEKKHCSENGGALYIIGNDAIVENSEFIGNYGARGGAIYVGQITYKNGTVYQRAKNPVINNCNFADNGVMPAVFERNVTKGGAIYSFAENTTVTNSNFAHNVGISSGAIQYEYGRNFLENNTFTGNIAEKYGGGAVSSTRQGDTINNCTFVDNFAQGYGGALSCDYPNVSNSTFKNNHANHGSAICTIIANVSDCEFYDNDADDGYVILAATDLTESNNVRPGQEVQSMIHTTFLNITYDTIKDLAFMDGYYAYCAEEDADYPRYGVLWEDLTYAQNALSEERVGEYLKILIFKYWVDEEAHNTLQKEVNIFTDHNFRESDDPRVLEVLSLYDSGYRVPENAIRVLENGTIQVFNFREVITPAATQNVFAFNISENPNLTVEKNLITKEPIVNNQPVEYNITVKNTGECDMTKIFVNDTDFSEGLVFDSANYCGYNWYYDNDNKVWIYNQTLKINETVNIILKFNVTKVANLTNNVSTGLANYTFDNDSENLTVYTPNMTVQKIADNEISYVGTQTTFTILVENTGDCNLTGVYVKETDYSEGLKYVSYNNGSRDWDYVDGKWYLSGILEPNESANFTVIFDVLSSGTLVNNITGGSNLTNETNATNNTTAFTPNMTVVKISNNLTVYVGNVTEFTIVVENTGDCNLSAIEVKENVPDGLIYKDFKDETGNWNYESGVFKYSGILEPGQSSQFVVLFDTIRSGNFTNFVTASSNLTNGTNSSNNTTVYTPNDC